MEQELIVPFDAFDTNQVIADREAIEQYIPQRFEMAQLDGVYFEDPEDYRAVGFKKITKNEFWTRGHMPEFPLMPGVLMCESAAQLIAYMGAKYDLKDREAVVGFGGLDKVRFRQMVVPESELMVMIRVRKMRRNVMVICDFQGFVDEKIVVDGEVRGVIFPPGTMS